MENLSPKDNLELIATMIKAAQRRFQDDSPYYILWGSTVFLAGFIQYLLILWSNIYNGLIWAILIPVALIVQFLIIRKQQKNEKSKTRTENLMNSMWIAFGITLFIILCFSSKLNESTFPVILCLYALSTFVSGYAFKIKAFLFGSIICWLLAILSFIITSEIQLIFLAIGALFAFFIPGVILRKQEKTELL